MFFFFPYKTISNRSYALAQGKSENRGMWGASPPLFSEYLSSDCVSSKYCISQSIVRCSGTSMKNQFFSVGIFPAALDDGKNGNRQRVNDKHTQWGSSPCIGQMSADRYLRFDIFLHWAIFGCEAAYSSLSFYEDRDY